MAGQPVTVSIRVKGSSGEVADPVPFDGVLVIDQSDSMRVSDPDNKRIDAAESFVDCVAAETRLGIVKYGDSASVVQGLTSNKTDLHSKLDGLRGQRDGMTNMYQAMEKAQDQLTQNGQSDRQWYIILLTDGVDNSGHQDTDFGDKAKEAHDLGIIYYNIALGSEANYSLLFMIAALTDGEAFSSTDPSELADFYDTICQKTSRLVKTREIILNEKVNITGQPCVRVKPGTISTSIENVTDSQIQEFEQTGQITAAIGTLGEGQERTFSFQVVSECLQPDAGPGAEVQVNIDDPASTVQYTFGLSQGSKPVPQASFLCRTPGDLEVGKIFDPTTMELEIWVRNNWPPDPTGVKDNSLKDLVIIEMPSSYFQPKRGSAVPPEAGFFPGGLTDYLVWRIASLRPKETVELKTILEPTLCSAQNQPPLDVDWVKYPGSGLSASEVYFTPPGGGTKPPQFIPNITTTLSQVETCNGRFDLFLEPAYTEAEYKADIGIGASIPWNVKYAHPRDETPMLFVDCRSGNGLWNGDPGTIQQYVSEATDVDNVEGQGDILEVGTTNVIYLRVFNVGTLASPTLSYGLSLRAFNYQSERWDELAKVTVSAIPAWQKRTVKIPFPDGPVSSNYIRPYKLTLEDLLLLVRTEAPSFAGTLSQWLNVNPEVRQGLNDLGELEPSQVSPYLQGSPAILNGFDSFMAQHPNTCWGKPSICVHAALQPGSGERHTNNNSTTEVIIVSQ